MKSKNLWEKGVDIIVDSLGYAIVRFAPVIAPIPSIAVILEVSGYSTFAWFTVVTIEMVGYAIGDKMVEAVRRGVFSLKKASIPLVIYALIIEGLMLGYRVIPAWYDGSSLADSIKASVTMLYPFFTLAGAGLYAFHEYLKEIASDTQYEKDTLQQKKEDDRQLERIREVTTNELNLELTKLQRQAELEIYKQKLAQDLEIEKQKSLAELRIKEDKAKAKIDSKSDSIGDSQNQNQNQKVIPVINYDSVVIDYYRDNPLASQRKAAKDLNISQPKISKTLSLLESANRIHRNGNGVEILEK